MVRRPPVVGAEAPSGARRLSVFTRNPVPGAAKTRLVPPLTPVQAAALQAAMTGDLLDRLGRALRAAGPPLALEVRHDRDLVRGLLEVPTGWAVAPQGPGDLGDRLARAARAARRDGIGRLVIIGADAPLLPLPLVEAGFSGLADRDVLAAPAEDGGYVLIALALDRLPETAIAPLFTRIPWGTPGVWQATIAAAGRAGLRFGELDGHWDVDRPEDLRRLAAAIRALDPAEQPRRTAALLAAGS